MILRFALLLVLAAADTDWNSVGWPTGSVSHHFFSTPRGQLHYVKGEGAASSTLVLLHGHPRSTTEFKYFAADLQHKAPFIAVDYFGLGLSEDYHGVDAKDIFCTAELYAKYVLQLLAAERVSQITVVGNLKGVNQAVEIAAQAGAGLVKAVVYISPLMLDAKGKEYIEHVFIPKQRAVRIQTNGSHLMDAWYDASSAAFGPDGKPDSDPKDLLSNEEEEIDALRCLSTGWQFQMQWAAYSNKQTSRTADIDAFAPTLIIYGTSALADMQKYGLNPQYTMDQLSKALTHGHNKTLFVAEGTQGMMVQNSSLIADQVVRFMYAHDGGVMV